VPPGHNVGPEEPADPYAGLAYIDAAADVPPEKDNTDDDRYRESGGGPSLRDDGAHQQEDDDGQQRVAEDESQILPGSLPPSHRRILRLLVKTTRRRAATVKRLMPVRTAVPAAHARVDNPRLILHAPQALVAELTTSSSRMTSGEGHDLRARLYALVAALVLVGLGRCVAVPIARSSPGFFQRPTHVDEVSAFPAAGFPVAQARPCRAASTRSRRSTLTGWTRSGSLRCVTGDQPPAFPERRGPGRVALAAGGRIRVVGREALPAGGTVLVRRRGARREAVGLAARGCAAPLPHVLKPARRCAARVRAI